MRVHASSVNGTDLAFRRGDLKVAALGQMPFTAGFDLAGEVLSLGPGVTAFSTGDHVMALLGHNGGGQARHVFLRQGRAALSPGSCTPEQAASLPLAGLTALQALYGKGGLHTRAKPARVLILGASGGVGSYAVQLANIAGAHVTGVASGSNVPFVASLGADQVVDRHLEDVTGLGER